MHDIKMIFEKDGGKPVKGKKASTVLLNDEQNVPHTPLSTSQSNDGLLLHGYVYCNCMYHIQMMM
jgi:hypothetical protein